MDCCFSASRSGAMRDGLSQKDGPAKNAAPVVRCAIYTRKSTEEGLEQDFNSLQTQREASEGYIHSQKEVGTRGSELRVGVNQRAVVRIALGPRRCTVQAVSGDG